MRYHPDAHHRHAMRWRPRDYSLPGAYFVTVVTAGRLCLFGEVHDGVLLPSAASEMVSAVWASIPSRFIRVTPGLLVVMPNHLHGILEIQAGAARRQASAGQSLLVRAMHFLKSDTTRRYADGVRRLGWVRFRGTLWQRSYHDRVLRDAAEHERARRYIETNPARWERDRENPVRNSDA